jgi:hypothetical protein
MMPPGDYSSQEGEGMRTLESVLLLVLILVVVALQIHPGTGEWSGAAQFRDLKLEFALRVDACSKMQFEGDISKSSYSILSFIVGRDKCAEDAH